MAEMKSKKLLAQADIYTYIQMFVCYDVMWTIIL
jgi:hypothetical protein